LRRLVFALLSALAGCAQAPVELPLGDVVVRVEPDQARIQIRRADGTVILDGIAAAPVPSGQPPLTGAAFRTVQADWTELYGNFQVNENPADWSGVPRFHDVQTAPDGVRFSLDGGGSGAVLRVADGTLQVTLSRPGVNRASAAFACAPDERFLGFGAMPMDVEHRGSTVPLLVSEQGIGRVAGNDQTGDWFLRGTEHQTYFPVPFFVSSRNYGVRGDTTYKSIYSMCSESDSMWRVEAWEGTVSFKLLYGTDPVDVIRLHAVLDGVPPIPPAFVFAPWNDAIRGSANVRAVAQTLRQNAIPSSVIWTEDWAGGIANGTEYHLPYNWNVDRTLYPDAEQVASDLHASGFKWLAYFNTFVRPDGDHWNPDYVIHQSDGTPYVMDGIPFGTHTSMVDLSNPDAAAWMGRSMDAALALGFDGWMADYGEWLPMDAQLADGSDPESAHTLYPVAWQSLSSRVIEARAGDGVDRIAFVRSGYTGSQPIAHQVVWGGDQTTDFDPGDGLASTVPIGLGLGVSGMPYYGSDVGGYTTVEATGHPPTTKELFFRWSALNALTPILRTHHQTNPDLEWRFDSDAETLAHWKRWATLHMQLYPYLRAAASTASTQGTPLMRQLALGFPGDPMAWTTADQFLLGPSLLVAPVLSMGATSRSVYFPAGHWVPLFGSSPQAAVDGPTTLDVAVPLGELPVYALPGAVLAMLPPDVLTLTGPVPPARRVLAVAGGNGSFSEADGASYVIASNATPSAAVTATWNGVPVTVTVDATARVLTATVTGNGTLALSDGSVQLTASNAPDPTRALTVELHW
jgi:alpha-D-xyloside xylohydrolase/alpha-glucosidase